MPGEAEAAMSCLILCFLWVCILPSSSLMGSPLAFRDMRRKRVCAVRDNTGQVQGLLIEFLLTFHIPSEYQPERGCSSQQAPSLFFDHLPHLLTALTSLPKSHPHLHCNSNQKRMWWQNWGDKHVAEEAIFEVGFASTVKDASGNFSLF